MQESKYCRYCGRLLKSQKSIERGFGLVCYKKYLETLKGGGLFEQFNKRKDSISKQTVSSTILHSEET